MQDQDTAQAARARQPHGRKAISRSTAVGRALYGVLAGADVRLLHSIPRFHFP